jgi:DNA-binding transcriptional LysR family regulator
MVPFELRLLEQAVALDAHRSFTRAAAALNQSQPTLSHAIRLLEDRTGAPLFHRGRRGVEPTDLGRVFLERARDILARVQDLDRETRLAHGLQSGSLSIGLGPYAAEVLLPVAAPRFVAAHPTVRVSIEMGTAEALLRGLRGRQFSFFVADTSVLSEEDDLDMSLRLAPIGGYVVGRKGHPLALAADRGVAAAFAYPFAMVSWLPPRVLQPILNAQELRRREGHPIFPVFPAVTCPSVDLAKRIAAESDVLVFTSLGLVQEELQAGRLTPLMAVPWLKTEWAVVRLRNHPLTPLAGAFVQELQRRHAEVLETEAGLAEQWGSGVAPPAPTAVRKGTGRRAGASVKRIREGRAST